MVFIGYSNDELDQVSKLPADTVEEGRFAMRSISPVDGKYRDKLGILRDYLSQQNQDWESPAYVLHVMIEKQHEIGRIPKEIVEESEEAYREFDAYNAMLIESNLTYHDVLAIIAELSRHCELDTPLYYHPGTTSYDILDTGRAYAVKEAWYKFIRSVIAETSENLCRLSELSEERGIIHTGRTHLQDTSPVPFSKTFSDFARMIAEEVESLDQSFDNLKGKISGMVGTGAGVGKVVGDDIAFEKMVLEELGLEPDYTATQVTNKATYTRIGNGLVNLIYIIGKFSNDVRKYYSSAIGEMTTQDNLKGLGLSSTGATKNNPINFENIAGTIASVESGMRILYETMNTDFERDLRSSKQIRYQPRLMMSEIYESFSRLNGRLDQLTIIEDRVDQNLDGYRRIPDEAMVTILKGMEFIHSKYGLPHTFVKEMGKSVKSDPKKRLIDVCREDGEFNECFNGMRKEDQRILLGEVELYIGSANERASFNRKYTREFFSRTINSRKN